MSGFWLIVPMIMIYRSSPHQFHPFYPVLHPSRAHIRVLQKGIPYTLTTEVFRNLFIFQPWNSSASIVLEQTLIDFVASVNGFGQGQKHLEVMCPLPVFGDIPSTGMGPSVQTRAGVGEHPTVRLFHLVGVHREHQGQQPCDSRIRMGIYPGSGNYYILYSDSQKQTKTHAAQKFGDSSDSSDSKRNSLDMRKARHLDHRLQTPKNFDHSHGKFLF